MSRGPTTDILIDVVGYTTNTGLQELVADVATKANAADVYTKTQVDSTFLRQGDIVESQGPSFDFTGGSGTPPSNLGGVSIFEFDTTGQQSLQGPESIGGVQYGLKSVTYCISAPTGSAFVSSVTVLAKFFQPNQFVVTDNTDRTAAGCYTVQVNNSSSDSYVVILEAGGAAGTLLVTSLTSTWAPASTLPAALTLEDPPSILDSLADQLTGG